MARNRARRVPVARYHGRQPTHALDLPALEAKEEERRRIENQEAIAMGGAIHLRNVPVPAHLPVRHVVPRGPRNVNNNNNQNVVVNGVQNGAQNGAQNVAQNGVQNDELMVGRRSRTQHSNELYLSRTFSKEHHWRWYFLMHILCKRVVF